MNNEDERDYEEEAFNRSLFHDEEPTPVTECETIRIVGMPTLEGRNVELLGDPLQGLETFFDFIIPAYTRTPQSFRDEVTKELAGYQFASRRNGTKDSLGDFALWLLRKASQEPREQGEDG